jgi:hypothetical protein
MEVLPMLPSAVRSLVALILALMYCSASACGVKGVVTVAEVDRMIEHGVQVGSSKPEVEAFIESLRIDSLRIEHADRFESIDSLHWDTDDKEKVQAMGDRLKDYYWAAIEDIAPSTTTFMIYIRMRFYFDSDGKLLDYLVKEDTGFR